MEKHRERMLTLNKFNQKKRWETEGEIIFSYIWSEYEQNDRNKAWHQELQSFSEWWNISELDWTMGRKKPKWGRWHLQSFLFFLYLVFSNFVTVAVRSINFIKSKKTALVLKIFFIFEFSDWFLLWNSIINFSSFNIHSLRKINVYGEYLNISYKK